MQLSTIVFFVLIAIGPAIGLRTAFNQRANLAGGHFSGRQFGPNIVAISSVAAANSGFIMIAAVGYGYTVGLSALWMPFAYFVGDLFYWFVFAPRLIQRMKEKNKETLAELLASNTTGWTSLPLRLAAIMIFLFVGLNAVSQYLVAEKAVSTFFDTPQMLTLVAIMVFSLAAILFGGVSSSIAVNVYQGGLMLAVALLSLASAIYFVFSGGELKTAFTSSPSGYWNLFGQFGEQSFVLFLIAFFFLGMSFAMTQPHVLARLASGKSELSIGAIRWRYLLLLQMMWVGMTLFGILLYILVPDLSDPEAGILVFGERFLPPFVLGALVAGIVAGALSTAESQLLVVSDALGLDIFSKMARRFRRKQMKVYDGVFRVFCAGLVLLFALNSNSSVLELIIVAASSISAAFIVPIICVIFNINVDGRALGLSIFSGGTVCSVLGLSGAVPTGFEIVFGSLAAGTALLVVEIVLRKCGATLGSKGA